MRLRYCWFLAAQWAWAGGASGVNYQLLDPTAFIRAIAVDAAGNTYFTGHTASATFPTTPGVFQPSYGGGQCYTFAPIIPPPSGLCDEAFVVKLDPTGAVVWATYLGGSGQGDGQAIAVDAAGNVYVAGITSAPQQTGAANDFPTTPGSAFPSAPPSVGAGFVVKLNPAGSQMLYGTFVPDYASTVAMAIDANGNAYVATQIEPAAYQFPVTGGAFQSASNAQETGVIVKLNSSGALVYATYLGGNGPVDVTLLSSIAVDARGNAYVTGTAPTDFPLTSAPYQKLTDGGAFVAKVNPQGSALVYSTFLGMANQGQTIRVDSAGRAYVLGTNSGPVLPGPFLDALSADGSSLIYGAGISGATAMDVDAEGDASVAGLSPGGLPVSAGAFDQCYAGNAFAEEYSPSGALIGASYFGPSPTTDVNALAVEQNGLVSIGGAGAGGAFAANFLIDNPLEQDSPCTTPGLAATVENAADYSSHSPSQVAAGEMVTLWGAALGPATGVPGIVTPGMNAGLPTQVAGVQVFFDEFAAPLMYVQAGQINAAVPWEIAGKTSTQVHVVYNQASSNTVTLGVLPSAPGLFYLGDPAVAPASQGAILNADGSINTPTNWAHPGDEIALFGTGGGPTNPAGVTGLLSGLNANTLLTLLPVTVRIGGVSAPVVYAGAAPGLLSALFQINVLVPPLTAPNLFAPVNVVIGTQATIGTVTVAVQ